MHYPLVKDLYQVPKKVHIKAKSDVFLTFMLLNFFVRTLQCAETLILKLFCTWKHEKNILKIPKMARSAKTVENSQSFFNISHTWYKSLIHVEVIIFVFTMLQFIDRMGLAGEDFCQGWRIFIVINKKVSPSMSDSCSLKMQGFSSLSLKNQCSSCWIVFKCKSCQLTYIAIQIWLAQFQLFV